MKLDSIHTELFELREVADLLKEDTELLKEAAAQMELNVDSLKAGQKVIYNEVRKPGNKKSLLDAIKLYLK